MNLIWYQKGMANCLFNNITTRTDQRFMSLFSLSNKNDVQNLKIFPYHQQPILPKGIGETERAVSILKSLLKYIKN